MGRKRGKAGNGRPRAVPVIAAESPPAAEHLEPLSTERTRRPKVSVTTRMAVYERDKYTCQHCRLTMGPGSGHEGQITIDHKKPLAAGGANKRSNMQVLCVRCNNQKADIYKGQSTGGRRARLDSGATAA